MTVEELNITVKAKVDGFLAKMQAVTRATEKTSTATKATQKQVDALRHKQALLSEALQKTTAEQKKLLREFNRKMDGTMPITEIKQTETGLAAAEKKAAKLAQTLDSLERDREKAVVQLDFAKGSGNTAAISEAKAAVVSIDKQIEPLALEFDETNAKAKTLKKHLAEIKANPQASAEIQALKDRMDGLVQKANRMRSESAALGEQIKSSAVQSGNAIKSASNKSTKATNKAANAVKSFGNRIKGLVKNVLIFSVITRALRAIRTALTSIIKSDSAMSQSLANIKGNLITAFAPIYSYILPGIRAILSALESASARLAYFTSSLFGKSVSQSQQLAKGMYNTAKGAGKAEKSAKKLSKTLLGIDEINAMADNSDTDAGGSGADTDSVAPAFNLEDIDMSQYDNLRKKIEDILWYVGAVGAGIAGWDVGKFLSGLDGCKSKMSAIAGATLVLTGVVLEIKGIKSIVTDGIDTQNFFETLLGGAALTGGAALIGKSFGKSILGFGVGAIIAGLPMYITGIYDAVTNGLNLLNGMLIPVGSTLLGAGLGAVFATAGTKIGALAGGPAGAAIGALVGLAVGAITDIVIAVVQHWDEIKAVLSKAGKWIYDNVIKPVIDFFKPVTDAVSEIFSYIRNKVSEILAPIGAAFSAIFSKIKEIFLKICEIFVALAKAFYTYVVTPVWNWIKQYIIEPVQKAATWVYNTLIKPVIDKAKELFDWLHEKLTWVKDKAVSLFKEIGIKVVDFISGTFKKVVNGIFSSIERGINGFIRMLNGAIGIINKIPGVSIAPVSPLEIPRLANGGVLPANNPRLAVVGDNRTQREIVTPENAIYEQALRALKTAGGVGSGGNWTFILRRADGHEDSFVLTEAERKNNRDGESLIPLRV